MKNIYFIFFGFLLAFSSIVNAQINLNACDALTDDKDFVLELESTDGTGRNIYQTNPITGDQPCSGLGTCEFQISWNTIATRWEILADSGNGDFTESPYVLYYNDAASLPNPPDWSLGRWIENTTVTSGICMNIETLSGDVQSALTFINYVFENDTWSPADPSGVSKQEDTMTIINGVATLTANTIIEDITVETGAELRVDALLTLAGHIVNNGKLIITASATSNGEIDILPFNSTIAGDIQVETFFKDRRAFRMVSSPITTTNSIFANWQESGTSTVGYGTHITGSAAGNSGFDTTTTGNPSMFTVNTTNQAFEQVSNTDVDLLTAGKAYLLYIRGDRTITLNASPADPATTTKLRATGSIGRGPVVQESFGANADEFGMFGNPYPSVVDMNKVLTNSSNINTNRYYVYDASLAERGAFVTVVLPAGTNTSGSSANQYLQVGQAAQMATLASGPASITFNEADKAPGNYTTTAKSGNTENPSDQFIIGQLFTASNYTANGPVHDSFGIYFNQNYNNLATTMDAVKAFNFDENIAIENGGKILSHDFRSLPLETEELSLYMNNHRNADYVLKLNSSQFEEQRVYLKDQFASTSTLLKTGENLYTFHVDLTNSQSIAKDRFSILFEKSTLGIAGEDVNPTITIFPNPVADQNLTISVRNTMTSMTIKIHNTLGQEIYRNEAVVKNGTATIPVGNLSKGVYLITIASEGSEVTKRFIKN